MYQYVQIPKVRAFCGLPSSAILAFPQLPPEILPVAMEASGGRYLYGMRLTKVADKVIYIHTYLGRWMELPIFKLPDQV